MVFGEILQAAYQLMTDVFGNYVIQKFFEVSLSWYHTTLYWNSDYVQYPNYIWVLFNTVWKCRPEAGFGNTYPWPRPPPGFADVWLQGDPESLGVHLLRPAGNCK